MSLDVSRLKKIGIALGGSSLTSFGATTTAFTRGLLASSVVMNIDQAVARVNEQRGSLRTTRVTKGPYEIKPTITYPLDLGDATSASIGDFLASIMGFETSTSLGGGLYKHKFTLLEGVEPSFINIYTNKDSVAKQVSGFRPSSVKITVNAKEAVINVEVTGQAKDEEDLAATQTLVYCSENMITPQMVSAIKIAGTATTTFETVEITITREQEGINILGTSRAVNNVVSGKEFNIEIAITGLKFADETERAKFKAVTTSSFQLTLTDSSQYLDFVMGQINYTTFAGPDINGADLLRVNMAAIASGDPSGNYVELVNKYASNYATGAAIS